MFPVHTTIIVAYYTVVYIIPRYTMYCHQHRVTWRCIERFLLLSILRSHCPELQVSSEEAIQRFRGVSRTPPSLLPLSTGATPTSQETPNVSVGSVHRAEEALPQTVPGPRRTSPRPLARRNQHLLLYRHLRTGELGNKRLKGGGRGKNFSAN